MTATLHQPAARDSASGVQTDLTVDGLLTLEAAAQFLSVSRSSVYQAMASGQLPWCQLGRARRIPRRALVEYAAANLTGGWARQSHNTCDGVSTLHEAQGVAATCGQSVASVRAQR